MFGAFGRDGQRRDQQIKLVGQQEGDAVRAGHGHQVQLHTQVLGQQLGYISVVAVGLVAGVHRAVGWEVHQHTDGDFTLLLDVCNRLGAGKRGQQRQRGTQAEGRDGTVEAAALEVNSHGMSPWGW